MCSVSPLLLGWLRLTPCFLLLVSASSCQPVTLCNAIQLRIWVVAQALLPISSCQWCSYLLVWIVWANYGDEIKCIVKTLLFPVVTPCPELQEGIDEPQ